MADTATPKLAYVATLVPVGCSLRCDDVLSNAKHCKSGIKILSPYLTQPSWAMAPRAQSLFTVVGARTTGQALCTAPQPRGGAAPALTITAGSPLPQLATPSEDGEGLRRWLGRRGAPSAEGYILTQRAEGWVTLAAGSCLATPKPMHETRGAARAAGHSNPVNMPM